jgi:hypothetical protein
LAQASHDRRDFNRRSWLRLTRKCTSELAVL